MSIFPGYEWTATDEAMTQRNHRLVERLGQCLDAEQRRYPTFTIHPVPEGKGRFYCGPTVLAMLTGFTREKIHRDINRMKRKTGWQMHKRINGRFKVIEWPLTTPVTGMSGDDLARMMIKYKLKPEWRREKYTSLRQLVADIGHFKQPIVVNVTGHYVLYYAGIVYDTRHPTGAPVNDHWYGRCRVKSYWIIRNQPKPKA